MAEIPEHTRAKIEAFCELRQASNELLKKESRVYEDLIERNNSFLAGEDGREGGLDVKTKILVFLGMHAASGTEQSIELSVTAALQAGISEAEILDSLDLALLTTGGTAVARVQFAIQVLKYRLGGAGTERYEFLDRVAKSASGA